MDFSNDRVSVYVLSESDTTTISQSQHGTRYRDAVHLPLPGGEGWLFDYGVLVFWGVDEDERLKASETETIADGIDPLRFGQPA